MKLPRRVLTAVAAAPIALCAAAGGTDNQPGPLTREQARHLVSSVVPEVERLRGLAFKRSVAVDLIDAAGARAYVARRLETFQALDDLEVLQRAYATLGLLPRDLDIVAALLDTLAEQAGGFYDPATGGYYLLRDIPARIAPAISAHELTHALEDQHYDLDARLREALHDDDRLFAISAVHEGSASLLMGVFLAERVSNGLAEAWELEALDAGRAAQDSSLNSLPPVLLRQLVGPYALGTAFLTRAALAPGRFPARDVDRAFSDAPRSSEQILHPEKYWNAEFRDDPKPVHLGAAGGLLGQRWSRRGTGRLGEISLALLVGAETPLGSDESPGRGERWTNRAAAGWGGDRWELWARGKRSVVLLATVWDSSLDAAEFAAALPTREDLRWRVEIDRVAVVAGDVKERTAGRLLDRMLGREWLVPLPRNR